MKGLITAIALVLAAVPALAHPPPDVATHSPQERAWWECMRNNKGIGHTYICCSVSDGHVLSDKDWGESTDKDGNITGYWVKVEGVKFPVPTAAWVSDKLCGGPDPDHPADAHVWYAPDRNSRNEITGIEIYCFLPGTMY